jgi:autotransporter-associated beta strand protein
LFPGNRKITMFRASLAVIALVLGVSVAQGQLYWDIDGATAGAGGATPAGTWDNATANWNLDPQGDGDTGGGTTWTAGGNAVFSAGTDASGAFTVTLSGTQTINSILFQEGTVTLAGGQLNLTSSGSPADYNDDGTVDAADYVAWRKFPALFGGAPGYDAWRTDFGSSGGGGGGTITTATGTTQTISSVIGGSIPLTKEGADRLILSGANIYNAGTNINTGTLQFANTTAMPVAGGVNVNAGATLGVNAGGAGEWTNATSGGGAIGGLIAGTGGQGTANQVTWTAGSNLGIDTTNSAGALSYSGVIGSFRAAVGTTNAVGLTKRGPGTLELSGANTYTGPTTLTSAPSAGPANILKAVATNTLPSSTVLTMPAGNGNAQLQLYAGSSSSSGDKFDQTVAGISGGGSGTAAPTVIDIGYATFTIDVPADESFRYDGYLRTEFQDPTTRGKVVKKGQGDLTLGGLNNEATIGLGMGGEFSMEEGRLIYVNNTGTGGNNALRPSHLTLKGGTIVKDFATPGASMSVTPRTLEIAGSFTMDMNGSEGNAQFLPSAPAGGLGGINLTVDNPTITVFGEVESFPANTPIGFTPSFILAGIITDGGAGYGITKAGTGTLSLNQANTYSGTTTIAEGSLRLVGNGEAGLGTGPVVLSGGNLEYSGAPIGGVRVMPVTKPVTMTADSGVGHTTGSGAGGFTLATGSATVDVIFSDFTATGGTLTIFNDGSSNEPGLPPGQPTGPYVGPIEFRVGFAGTGFDFTRPIVTVNHTHPDLEERTASLMSTNTSGSHTFSGVISGNGGYVRNGAGGTSVLTANNTYTGDTKILAGTLSITNPYLSDIGDVYLTTGSIFDLDFAIDDTQDTIDQLFIDGIAQATGTWGGIGSGAANESALITGGGWLLVTAAGSGGGGAVPEPGTLALAAMAMFAMIGGRRRG